MEDNGEMKEVEESKFKRVKRHLGENKKAYIVGSAIFVIGFVSGVLYKRDGSYVNAMIKNGMSYKPQSTIHTTVQTISMYGNRLGRPGIPVIDMTTGKRFESITLAATATGVDYNKFMKHLNGKLPDVEGHVFERALN